MLLDRNLITLGHGAGGRLSHELIEQVFVPAFGSSILAELDDGAWIEASGPNVCITTDAFVVKPLFFPGGDIGSLAVYGTINDLAVMGAKPIALSCSFVLEEGLELPILKRIAASMAAASKSAGVPIVTGDTKVVEKGAADGVFITTTGVGQPMDNARLRCRGLRRRGLGCRGLGYNRIEPGDNVIITGTIGDHGTAVLLARERFEISSQVASDCAPIHELVATALASGADVKFMRDPTRGGLATVLNEIASKCGMSIAIDEANVPIKTEVSAALELLGLDPFYVASEGRCVMVVAASDAQRLVATLAGHELGRQSAVIGRVEKAPAGMVSLASSVGGRRILPMLTADQLPRIC